MHKEPQRLGVRELSLQFSVSYRNTAISSRASAGDTYSQIKALVLYFTVLVLTLVSASLPRKL